MGDDRAGGFGVPVTEERLADIFLSLQEQGAHNINLVSATPHTDAVLRVLDRVRGKSLTIPVVWNSGGYERVETLRRLEGYVDIYLPDYKYHDLSRAERYSRAADYPETALAAIREMVRQTGKYVIGDDGILALEFQGQRTVGHAPGGENIGLDVTCGVGCDLEHSGFLSFHGSTHEDFQKIFKIFVSASFCGANVLNGAMYMLRQTDP